MEDRAANILDRVSREGAVSCSKFVKHQPKGEQVCSRVQLLSTYLLGGQIRRSSKRRARSGQCRIRAAIVVRAGQFGTAFDRIQELGHSGIKNLHLATIRNEDVRRLDIPMNDSLLVSRIQSVDDLNCDISPLRQSPLGLPCCRSFP